jgi:hypothetical protein
VPRKLSDNPNAIKARERYQKLKAAGLSPQKSPESQRAYRAKRNLQGRPVHKEWASRPDVKARIKKTRAEHRAQPEVRAQRAEYQKTHRAKPDQRAKVRARAAVNAALDSGKLTRQPCEKCGDPDTHGHHDDHAKPLDVRWLCPRHHIEAHGGTFRPVTNLPTPCL